MLSLENEILLQALEKIAYSNYWVTLICMFLFVCIVLLKAINARRLKETAFYLFNIGFLESDSEEKRGFFDVFQIVIFNFSVVVLSLIFYRFKVYNKENFLEGFSSFYPIFLSFLIYFFTKRLLEYALSYVFLLKKEVKIFMISKSYYLYAISFLLYIAVVLEEYTSFSASHLFFLTGFLFIGRFVFLIVINKKLIFRQLFYFILYLCAFEIAPLFILFKLMF